MIRAQAAGAEAPDSLLRQETEQRNLMDAKQGENRF
jgi:hypothetical protein